MNRNVDPYAEAHGQSALPQAAPSCEEVEILLADYLDQTLAASECSRLEAHLLTCAPCRQLAEDIGGAMAFVERAAVVEAPPELVNKLLFEITSGPSRSVLKPGPVRRLIRYVFGEKVEAGLQPRFVMGMAMTALSLGMMLRVGGVRELKPADLAPTQVFANAEYHVTRMVDRGIQRYETLPIVFEMESMYREWAESREAEQVPAGQADGVDDGADGASGENDE